MQKANLPIALTVDVEDYFQVSAFESSISRAQWDAMPHRVAANTEKVLDIFEEFSLHATFFVLGWVAERYPMLVQRMVREGHEVACHGYDHARITTMQPETFRQDVERSRKLLQDISGQAVEGYRAPSYTITQQTLWALDILIDVGFRYDSSIFPIHHDVYGIPGGERFPYVIMRKDGQIKEFPPSTLTFSILGKSLVLPFSGGGYLRLLPSACLSAAFGKLCREGRPCALYFHPWEIDPDQPRVKAPLKSRFRHYLNLRGTENKLRRLFAEYHFAPMSTVLNEVLPSE